MKKFDNELAELKMRLHEMGVMTNEMIALKVTPTTIILGQ